MLALTFSVGESRFAVDACGLIGVVPRIDLRPVPHAPAFIAGVIDLEGAIASVVDLGVLLGTGACTSRLGTRILLAKGTAGRPFGLIAERVTELCELPNEAGVPDSTAAQGAPYLGPIVSAEDGLIQILRIEAIAPLIGGPPGEPRGGR